MHGYVPGANTPTQMDQAPNATTQSAPVHLRQGRDAGPTNDARQPRPPGARAQHRPQ
jgi:hypothetical protein